MPNTIMPVEHSSALSHIPGTAGGMSAAGLGLGELVKKTGEAVADTQNLLNATSRATASALATTKVDVIAVEEKVYHDNGLLDTSLSRTIDQKLPLITFIDPVFYQWSSVRVQGRFVASQFEADRSASTTVESESSSKGQSGLFLILGSGYNNNQKSESQVDTASTASGDNSFGQMRMNCLLEPRTDVHIPKPSQAIRGPRLTIIQGPITDIAGVTPEAPIAARTMSVIIQYNKRSGEPIPGRLISVETSGVSWSYVGDSNTDAAGQAVISLRREFASDEADRSPAEVLVSCRKGLVQNSTTVVF